MVAGVSGPDALANAATNNYSHGGGRKDIICFRCNAPGHTSRNCRAPAPVPRGKRNKAPGRAPRDCAAPAPNPRKPRRATRKPRRKSRHPSGTYAQACAQGGHIAGDTQQAANAALPEPQSTNRTDLTIHDLSREIKALKALVTARQASNVEAPSLGSFN